MYPTSYRNFLCRFEFGFTKCSDKEQHGISNSIFGPEARPKYVWKRLELEDYWVED